MKIVLALILLISLSFPVLADEASTFGPQAPQGSPMLESERDLASIPPTASISLAPEEHNGDYLNRTKAYQTTESSVNTNIFDKTISEEMMQKFNAYNDAYETREHYQLNGAQDWINYQQSSKDLAEWTIKKLLQYHFEHTIKNGVEESARRMVNDKHASSGDKGAAQAVMTLSKVHKVINNTTFKLGENTKTRFKYDFPSGLMRMGMTGPLFDATVDYHIRSADQQIGAQNVSEKMNITMNKKLPELKANTQLCYGFKSETINYTITKELISHTNAQIDQLHNMRDHNKDETIFRLNIGTSF